MSKKTAWTKTEITEQFNLFKAQAGELPPELVVEIVRAFKLLFEYFDHRGVDRATNEELQAVMQKNNVTVLKFA